MGKGHDELVKHIEAIFNRHGLKPISNFDAVEEIVQFMEIVINEHVEFHRTDADGDWRAAIRTLSAGQPTYAMPHPMTLLDRAEYLVQNLRDNRPEADDDR